MPDLSARVSLKDLRRLIMPGSVALIGAGAWTDAVADGSARIQYRGEVWRVHPTRSSNAQAHYFRSVDELPGAPDAAFVAVPSAEAPAVVADLSRRGAGGFVCFAAGFSETATRHGMELTEQLVKSANGLPFLGPNCYGMVNFFDRVALWPDQVVGNARERGVALICQSGTIALTLMFNRRSLPIGYLFTVGNQTGLAAEDLIEALCDDARVSAFGLYLEGIKDPERFARAAMQARAAGKPIAVVKSGRTAAAAATALSHTGALAGTDAVFDAFCRETGIARCDTLSTLCETLKLFHSGGPLRGRRVVVMGASGGDMAMTADISRHLDLEFPAFSAEASGRLRAILSDRVAISNPFDIHTYLWFEHQGLQALFSEVFHSDCDAVAFMLDCPPRDRADDASFTSVIDLFITAGRGKSPRAALISSLPETQSEETREKCLMAGVAPLQGQREALEALAFAGAAGTHWRDPSVPKLLRSATAVRAPRTLTEHEAKMALAEFGVTVPHSALASPDQAAEVAARIGFPVAMKVSSAAIEHKSEAGGVVLNVQSASQAAAAARSLARLSDQILVEQMITDFVAELLVGIVVDPQFGQALVVGAGGVLTEMIADTEFLLPPWTRSSVEAALPKLRCARLLQGFRGRPVADGAALVDAILAIGRYAEHHVDTLVELDVNPVVVRPAGRGAVAVDALIRQR